MKCGRCGTQNPDGSENCFNCGSSILATQPTATPVGVQQNAAGKPSGKLIANVDIAGTFLTITDIDIKFGYQQMRCADVTGIRYGVYKHYTNGIRTSRSYAIWISDGRSVMSIECVSFMASSATVESRYQQALKGLYTAVMVGLLQSFFANIDGGAAFQIGEVLFDKRGMHRSQGLGSVGRGLAGAWAALAGGLTVEQREQRHRFLPWSDFRGHLFGDGNIYIYRNPNDRWATFSLRDTWNAVCLGPFLSFLNESGALKAMIAAGV